MARSFVACCRVACFLDAAGCCCPLFALLAPPATLHYPLPCFPPLLHPPPPPPSCHGQKILARARHPAPAPSLGHATGWRRCRSPTPTSVPSPNPSAATSPLRTRILSPLGLRSVPRPTTPPAPALQGVMLFEGHTWRPIPYHQYAKHWTAIQAIIEDGSPLVMPTPTPVRVQRGPGPSPVWYRQPRAVGVCGGSGAPKVDRVFLWRKPLSPTLSPAARAAVPPASPITPKRLGCRMGPK